MIFENKYRKEAQALTNIGKFEGARAVCWRSPSNIALVKYWGKREVQIPQNPSLSFSLENSYTETKIEYYVETKNGISIEYKFEGKQNKSFEKRILNFLNSIVIYLPFLKNIHLNIRSSNSFPHSTGIASSASAMSSLALCLVSIENQIFNTVKGEDEFFKKASFLARLGSGSASRSVYGNFVCWGKCEKINNSADEIGVPVRLNIHEKFSELFDAVLITSSEKKKISSRKGHQLMESHPYAIVRYQQAKNNLLKLIAAMETGDESTFVTIVENEALSLHSLMLSSNPGYMLFNNQTWNIISKIRDFRSRKNIMITFTLDAGPNVHLIYQGINRELVKKFIKNELLTYCEDSTWIDDKNGTGPIIISN